MQIVQLSDAVLSNLLDGTFDNIKPDLLTVLKNSHVVIDSQDELQEVIKLIDSKKQNIERLSVTIAPTMLCNFMCPYCFEPSREKDNACLMSEEVEKHVVQSVIEFIEKFRPSDLIIDWFGGEPVLGIKRIKSISEKLIPYCKKNNIKHTGKITTNGSILDDKIIDVLLENNILQCQVTIDGSPRTHNVRRVSKDHKPTFDKIIQNITKAVDAGLDVTIRTNIDNETCDSVFELHAHLKKIGLYNKVKVIVAHTSENDLGKDQNVIDDSKFFTIRRKVIDDRCQDCPPITEVNSPIKSCSAACLNHVNVGPDGSLYACANDFGRNDKAIGNIKDHDFVQQKLDHAINFVRYDPSIIEECRECKLLPVCGGECPNSVWNNVHNDCHPWFYNPEIEIDNYIKSMVALEKTAEIKS